MRKTDRHIVTAILAALFLSGCLSSGEQTSFNGDTSSNSSGGSNNAPTIYGNPHRSVLVNTMYSFNPQASDTDGDKLTFSVRNLPRWAAFDQSTGRLSGQPLLGDLGSYPNIQISVSDGKTSTSLASFSITVSETALGVVTLNWLPPTENTDGSALQDLAGYKIYYGRSSRIYDHEIEIDSPGITSYVVDNLLPDTYYFAATAINSTGIESNFSGEDVRTVN